MESELKFVVPNHQLAPALNIIGARCTKDVRDSVVNISSIYYDSQVLNSLYEKINSDYYKSKFRLRWYQDSQTDQFSDFSYAEAKFRIGSQRQKFRVPSKLKPIDLASISLENNQLDSVVTDLIEGGLIINKPLFPVVLIQYQRQRFIEPVTGSRISIDSNIQALRWNRRMLPGASASRLQNTVIEVKGRQSKLPQNLELLTQFGVRKASFSKYLSCLSCCHQVSFDPR